MSFTALVMVKMCPKATDTSLPSKLNDCFYAEVTKNNDLLAFWHSHEETTPGLAPMAKVILAIPIAGVSIKQIISVAQRVYTYQ
jgi:hypothetical protein